jgi:hypothetical protein
MVMFHRFQIFSPVKQGFTLLVVFNLPEWHFYVICNSVYVYLDKYIATNIYVVCKYLFLCLLKNWNELNKLYLIYED